MVNRVLMVGVLGVALAAWAQEPKMEGPASYKVELRIVEGAGAPRNYTMLVDGAGKGVFRLGQKVAYTTGPNQYNYADVGVNIDCRVRDNNGRILLNATVEFSNVLPGDKDRPTIGQTRMDFESVLISGKPATIGVVDDPLTQRKLSVDATVTRLN